MHDILTKKIAKKSIIYTILVLALFVPSSSCRSVADLSSVVEFDCKHPDARMKEIPGTPGILVAPTFCKDYVFSEDKLQKALHVFVSEYSNTFDESEEYVWLRLSGLRIETSILGRKVSAAFDSKGNLLKDVHVTGLALSHDHIWVEILTKQINTSSFVHELVHVMIWKENYGIHGDPDHEGDKFSGWSKKHTMLIKRVNLILQDAGI